MFTKKNQKSIIVWTLTLLLSAASFASVLAQGSQNSLGGDSPQTVFAAARKAGADKDFHALLKLVAPSEYAMMAFFTDMGVGMFVEFYEGEKSAELKAKYEKVQKKYKITTEGADDSETLTITQDTPQEVIDAHMLKRAEKLYGHVDVVSYVPELMGIILDMPEMAGQTFVPQEALSGLIVDGDRATGTAGEKSIGFIREGGRWYLSADIMN